ncbi:MAG: YbaK/EbsC family protein [Patescibacteria group bacterium]
MVDQEQCCKNLINNLNTNNADYKLFEHRVALTYEDLQAVQREAGFIGAEGKCMVLKSELGFIVYVTLQGKRVDLERIKNTLGVKKIRLALPEELKEYFGAEPGCAYPFGFSEQVDIYVDPNIYKQEWFLFSPVYPSKTIQVKGTDLEKVFSSLNNKVTIVTNFNQA